jgi:osmotically inducible protein OsmC
MGARQRAGPTGRFDPCRGERMPTRNATTTWNGGLQDGSGQVELTSSGAGRYAVSFPRRTADEAGGVTSPEELIAAAHSSCFAMQFSALLGQAGGQDIALTVTADVTLGPDPAGGLRIPGIVLRVAGSAQGVDADDFARLAQEAKATCPVSKALSATPITLEVG